MGKRRKYRSRLGNGGRTRNRWVLRVFLLIVVLVVGLTAGARYAYRKGFLLSFRPPIQVEQILSGADRNKNGQDDSLDVLQGARAQVQARPVYRSAYYDGGYPPETEGVCTDLIWRALGEVDYDLKARIDADIAQNVKHYPRTEGRPDPNIDFRRVPNIAVFLQRNAQSLTTEVRPWDGDNLVQWQPGDIVIFGMHNDHIGIVSDKRTRDGTPLIIHHGSGRPVEDNALGYWREEVSGHFRLDPEG